MINEHSRAVVIRDIPNLGIKAGDVGVVVHIHQDSNGVPIGYMLETFGVDGDSLDVVSVGLNDVRAVLATDRLHARNAA